MLEGNSGVMKETKKVPELVMVRTFDAPRRLVWDAWTKAEHVARWFTPRPRCVAIMNGRR